MVVTKRHLQGTQNNADRDEVLEILIQREVVAVQLGLFLRWALQRFNYQADHLLLLFNPLFLVTRHEEIPAHFLFETVELVDHDSNEQVHDEDIAGHDKRYEKECVYRVNILTWLGAFSLAIDSIIHNLEPSLCGYYLEEYGNGFRNIIEVTCILCPCSSVFNAGSYVCDFIRADIAVLELTFEVTNSNYGIYKDN